MDLRSCKERQSWRHSAYIRAGSRQLQYVHDLASSGSLISSTGPAPARALYEYTATNADEVSLVENEPLTVIDKTDPDWWKIDRDGVVGIVPALYVEVLAG